MNYVFKIKYCNLEISSIYSVDLKIDFINEYKEKIQYNFENSLTVLDNNILTSIVEDYIESVKTNNYYIRYPEKNSIYLNQPNSQNDLLTVIKVDNIQTSTLEKLGFIIPILGLLGSITINGFMTFLSIKILNENNKHSNFISIPMILSDIINGIILFYSSGALHESRNLSRLLNNLCLKKHPDEQYIAEDNTLNSKNLYFIYKLIWVPAIISWFSGIIRGYEVDIAMGTKTKFNEAITLSFAIFGTITDSLSGALKICGFTNKFEMTMINLINHNSNMNYVFKIKYYNLEISSIYSVDLKIDFINEYKEKIQYNFENSLTVLDNNILTSIVEDYIESLKTNNYYIRYPKKNSIYLNQPNSQNDFLTVIKVDNIQTSTLEKLGFIIPILGLLGSITINGFMTFLSIKILNENNKHSNFISIPMILSDSIYSIIFFCGSGALHESRNLSRLLNNLYLKKHPDEQYIAEDNTLNSKNLYFISKLIWVPAIISWLSGIIRGYEEDIAIGEKAKFNEETTLSLAIFSTVTGKISGALTLYGLTNGFEIQIINWINQYLTVTFSSQIISDSIAEENAPMITEEQEEKGSSVARRNYIFGNALEEYYVSAMNKLLELRLEQVISLKYENKKIEILDAKVIKGNLNIVIKNIIEKFIYRIQNNKVMVIPFLINISSKLNIMHWTGLILDKNDKIIKAIYLDSDNQEYFSKVLEETLLSELKKQITTDYLIKFSQSIVKQQKYNNCGPELIENIAKHLTGHRVSQEEAIYLHSIIYEFSLTNKKIDVLKAIEVVRQHSELPEDLNFEQNTQFNNNWTKKIQLESIKWGAECLEWISHKINLFFNQMFKTSTYLELQRIADKYDIKIEIVDKKSAKKAFKKIALHTHPDKNIPSSINEEPKIKEKANDFQKAKELSEQLTLDPGLNQQLIHNLDSFYYEIRLVDSVLDTIKIIREPNISNLLQSISGYSYIIENLLNVNLGISYIIPINIGCQLYYQDYQEAFKSILIVSAHMLPGILMPSVPALAITLKAGFVLKTAYDTSIKLYNELNTLYELDALNYEFDLSSVTVDI